MATTPTTNFSWGKPTVGGSLNVWGTELNTALDAIDTDVNTIKTTADAALPKAGGTMTGNLVHLTDSYTLVNKGSMSGAVTFDLSAGNYFYGTVAGAITSITFSNVPANGVFFVLELTNGAAYSISWPAAVKWPGGSTPTLQSSGVDVLGFLSRDAGTTIRGSLLQGNSS